VAAHDAGVQVTCPGCGQTVLQKAMIPVLGEEGLGVRYLCATCARALMAPPTIAGGGLSDETDPGGATAADSEAAPNS
jgi:DNA-directed RNA polymerase subunit RPC12/RpoP